MHRREGRRAVGEGDLQHAGAAPKVSSGCVAPSTSISRRPSDACRAARCGADHAVAVGDARIAHAGDDDAVGVGRRAPAGLAPAPRPDRAARARPACARSVRLRACSARAARRGNRRCRSCRATISAIAWRRWSSTCTNAPTQMVSRNAMMSAGTARRSAGSAVSSRRYAGLAIDCASPLIESSTDRRARRLGARHGVAPVRIHPDHLHRKDVPHLPESLCIGIERWRICRESLNEFLS